MKPIRIASFDIGINNFACYVEDIECEVLYRLREQYNEIPRKYRKALTNIHTKRIINQLLKSGKIVSVSVRNLSDGQSKLNITIKKNIISHLLTQKKLFKTCDVFVIEAQFVNMRRGRRNRGINVDAMKVAEIVSAFMIIKFPTKEVYSFPSRHKTECFGSEAINKQQRKKWCVEFGEKMCIFRGDTELVKICNLSKSIKRKRKIDYNKHFHPFVKSNKEIKIIARQIIKTRQKLDDIFDAMIQCKAFMLKVLIANNK